MIIRRLLNCEWSCALLEKVRDKAGARARNFRAHSIIHVFMEKKRAELPAFVDPLMDVRFCMSSLHHGAPQSAELQGREQLINELFQFVSAFETKLPLCETQLRNANYVYFPTLIENKLASPDTYAFVAVIGSLTREFADRFADLRSGR